MGFKKRKPAVFLDRDGTLIPDSGYLNRASQVKLYRGTAEALRLLRRAGYYVFVVTNQSGVARGYFSESAVKAVHRKLLALLRAKGAKVDAIFYCPHYPGGKVKTLAKVCDCRKPKTGMVKQALRKYPVDLKRSFAVGDKIDDLQLARNAKLAGGILVGTGKGRESQMEIKGTPLAKCKVVSNVLMAAKYILKSAQSRNPHGR